MNSILAKSSETRANNIRKPSESVETAGSLAMRQYHSLFDVNVYDMFSTSNPFAIDYSQYAEGGETVAYGGFLSSFSNAVSVLGSSGESSFSGGDCGFSGGGSVSCGSSGGFTSFC